MSISSSSLIDNRSDPYPSGGGPSVVQRPEPEPARYWHGGGAVAWQAFSKAKGNRQGFALWRFSCVWGVSQLSKNFFERCLVRRGN